jgi:chromosomal replication initiator protein
VPESQLPPAPECESDLQELWAGVTRELRAHVTDLSFEIWFAPLNPAALRGGTLYVRAPDHIRTWVGERYLPLLRKAAARTVGAAATEIVDERWEPPDPDTPAEPAETPARGSRLNPKYTFEQFVICDGNRLAHAAALAVAEMPSHAYNPLFIHGPPGLGKTHLLHAIGNYLQTYGGGLRVRYATVEEFTSEFVHAVRGGETETFKETYRDVDVLLVDDTQFLAQRLRTKEEFFHTFNTLYETGSQLVMTSDRRPHDMNALEDRLRERFECGLVAQLEPPDFEARMTILQKRTRLDALPDVDDETLAAVARHVTASVRTLEGALIRVVAYSSLRGEELTPELAERVLARLYPSPEPRCTLEEIRTLTADEFGVSEEEILAHDRRPRVVLARQIAMYLARELTDQTLPAIGKSFGGRNHSTVLHAHRRVKAAMRRSLETSRVVSTLSSRLTGQRVDRA